MQFVDEAAGFVAAFLSQLPERLFELRCFSDLGSEEYKICHKFTRRGDPSLLLSPPTVF